MYQLIRTNYFIKVFIIVNYLIKLFKASLKGHPIVMSQIKLDKVIRKSYADLKNY